MKKIISLITYCVLTVLYSPLLSTNVSGVINSNSNWTTANSPYIVTGNITINSGVTLTIENGVEIKFDAEYGFIVYGELIARHAIFTSNQLAPHAGDWGQIQSAATSATITLDTCSVEYAGSAGYGAICASLGTLHLTGTSISNSSSSGLYLHKATVYLQGSTISNCNWAIYYNACGLIEDLGANSFSGNKYDAAYLNFSSVSSSCSLPGLTIPFVVPQNMYVDPGVTLKLESGCVIKFASQTGLFVNGTLEATNTLFTTLELPSEKGAWRNISVGDDYNSGIATLDSCTIEYAGNSGYGSLYAYRGNVTVSHSTIQNSSSSGICMHSNGVVQSSKTMITNCDWPITYLGAGAYSHLDGNQFINNTHNAVNVAFNNLYTHWELDELPLPYLFNSWFDVLSSAEMVVHSGNILKSSDWLYIDGVLRAIGESDKRITFTTTVNDNIGGDTNLDGAASSPESGSWGGVIFRNSSRDDLCVLKRCDFSFGGNWHRGVIVTEDASPVIDSCTISNSYYGAEFTGQSAPVFTNNHIASSTMVPVAMSFDSNPVFTQNVFSFSDNQYDAIGLLGGTISTNSHLIQRNFTGVNNVTYLLLGELVVPDGFTLTIDPGIVIKSYYYSHAIRVLGALVANGYTGEGEIVFTSAKDDNVGNPKDTNKDGTQTNPNRGDWSGIIFEGGSNDTSSKLEYCSVIYASMSGRWYNPHWIDGGAITMINASPTINHSIVKDATYGIFAYQVSNPIIQHTQIINAQYTPITFSVSANPTLENISFVNNGWNALGIIGEYLGVGGVLGQRDVAGYHNITYVLLNDLTIKSGVNVTIEPGVVIKMQNNIYVDGGLKVDGLASDSIVFTSINDDNYGMPNDTRNDGNGQVPAKGNWGQIQFRATSDDVFSQVNYCKLLYGGNTSAYNSILTYTDASSHVSNTLISDSYGWGIRFEGSASPDCTDHVTIRNCGWEPIAMSLTSNPKMDFYSPAFAFMGNAKNGIKILEGELSTDATLTRRDVGGIYNVAYIIDRLTIQPSTTLTIKEGVVIKVLEYYNYGITVHGALKAEGTQAQPIVFTSIKDDSKGGDTNGDGNNSTPNRGDWGYVRFNSSSLGNTNVLRNCIFNYGGNGEWWYTDNYGNIRIYNTELVIDSCKIEHSYSSAIGIYGNATPLISHCEMNNISSTPITLSMFSNPTFSNNQMANIGISAIGVVPENFANDAVIPKRDFAGYNNMTYYLHGTCTVNSGTHLTIPAGVVFKSDDKDFFDVNGRLSIDGTADSPVVFTNVNDDEFGNPLDSKNDGWHAIEKTNCYNSSIKFEDVCDDNSTVNYTILNYANYGIYLQQASPSILHCSFNSTRWGVVLNGVSAPKLDNCSFHNLQYCPVLMSLVSYPISTNNNVISGTSYKALGVLPEELVQDVTLSKRNFGGITNIPYYFSGSYTVGTSVSLTVAPGVVCKFPNYALLSVKKGLLALGGASVDSTIVFTDYRDDFYGGDMNSDSTATSPDDDPWNRWHGIDFQDVSLDKLCKLDHCILRYSYYNYWSPGAAISMNAASPSITNSLIADNQNGVVIYGASNPIITGCDLVRNADYGVNNINQAFNVNATNCWWGANTGPSHSSNPSGKGAKISDYVNYSPYKSVGALNPLVGDVSLNGSVQAYDASLILQKSVGLVAFNKEQLEVGDVSGDGSISAYDATLVLKYVAGINTGFPVKVKTNVSEIVDLSASEVSVNADKQYTVTLYLKNNLGVGSVDLTLGYDTSMLTPLALSAADPLNQQLFASNIALAPGLMKVSLAGTTDIPDHAAIAQLKFSLHEDVKAVNGSLSVQQLLLDEKDLTNSVTAIPLTFNQSTLSNATVTNNHLWGIYPNPMRSNANLYFVLDSNQTKVKVEIMDVAGQLVEVLFEGSADAGYHQIPVEHFGPAGLYFVRMTTAGKVYTQKLMVEK